MRNNLVPIYYGLTADDALELGDRLRHIGVESFIESTESPMYGMRYGPAANVLYIRGPATEQVRQTVREFELDGHPQLSPDQRGREQTGLELPTEDRPQDDSPAEGVHETTERMDADRATADIPELDAFEQEGFNHGIDEEEIESIGPDRPLAQQSFLESDEVQDQDLDDLHIVEWYTDEDREER